MKDCEAPASPYRLIRPVRPTPLIYAVAHAGREFPADGRDALQATEMTIRSLEDPLVDALLEGVELLGATILVCRVARAWIDVNRDPAELDPALLDGPGGRDSPRTRAGLGLIPRLGGDARPLYRRKLTGPEVEARLATVHRPYHAALGALLDEAREAFGQAVLVDWHSMPSAAAVLEGRRGGMRPDIVVGDRHGASTASTWSGALRSAFEERGRRVLLNRPFAGGHTTQAFGRPTAGMHAVQVEIDRSLYLDEASLEPTTRFGVLQADIAAVTSALTARLHEKKAAPGGAA